MIDRLYVPARYLIMMIAAVIIAALLTVAGPKQAPAPIAPLVTTPSASADAFSSFLTPNQCLNHGARTHCFQVGWRKQSDGSGVQIEDAWLNTNNGCGTLESTPYRNSEPSMYRHPEHTFKQVGDWGTEPCNIHHDFVWYGDDTGPVDFRWTVHVNLSGGTDYVVVWRVTLWPDGSWARESFRTEAP